MVNLAIKVDTRPVVKALSEMRSALQPAELSQHEFRARYVLNRARAVGDNLAGEGAAKEANRAWQEIERLCAK